MRRTLSVCLSVCPSVCPSVQCMFTLEHRSRVFVNLADVWYHLFCLHFRAAYSTAISAAQACFFLMLISSIRRRSCYPSAIAIHHSNRNIWLVRSCHQSTGAQFQPHPSTNSFIPIVTYPSKKNIPTVKQAFRNIESDARRFAVMGTRKQSRRWWIILCC